MRVGNLVDPGMKSSSAIGTGFLFSAEALLSEVDSHVAYSVGQWVPNWWAIPFAALMLGFPSGHLGARIDRVIVGALVLGTVVLQLVWLFFLPFPPGKENVFLLAADAGVANVIDRVESSFNGTVALVLAIVSITRWIHAAVPMRRLLLPTLAGALTLLVLVAQVYYAVLTGEFIRSSQAITSALLVTVPLAFLLGMLRQQLARAGMADLVVALHRAPEPGALGEALGKALGDPSLVLAHWLPRFEAYVDADGIPIALPEPGSGRTATFVDSGGRHIAALVHDAALDHQPELLEAVCAAANVALEQERLQAELAARVVELQSSRERIVAAGDAERRAARAQPPRRRAAAPRRDCPAAAPAEGSRRRRPLGGRARRGGQRPARAVARGAARGGAGPAPGGAAARAGHGARLAGRALDRGDQGDLRAE